MNEIIFNGEVIDEKNFHLEHDNRAFMYGDGLFETMHIVKGGVRFLDRHLDRLKAGLYALSLDLPKNFLDYPQIIDQFLSDRKIDTGTLRWQFWRASGGKYTPRSNASENLLQYSRLVNGTDEVKLGISNRSQVSFSPVSRFKTCNALPYIIAGSEMKESEFNDLILLDHAGNIAECIASNIFWSNNKHWYTPSLETGCVEGIMRNVVIEQFSESGTPLKIGKYGIEYFLDIQKAFITNSSGIYPVSVLGEIRLSESLNLPGILKDLRVR